jgi:hypothetical protein
MKTLDEAMACLWAQEGESPDCGVVVIDGETGETQRFGKSNGAAGENLLSLIEECGANKLVRGVASNICHLTLHQSVGMCSDKMTTEEERFLYTLAVSLFVNGFAYGCRVGMEMEKQDGLVREKLYTGGTT